MSDTESFDEITSAGNTSHDSWVDLNSCSIDSGSDNGTFFDQDDCATYSDLTDLDLDSLSISSLRSSFDSVDSTPIMSHAKVSLPKSVKVKQKLLEQRQQPSSNHVRNVRLGRRKQRRAENDSLQFLPSSLFNVPEGSEVSAHSAFPAPEVKFNFCCRDKTSIYIFLIYIFFSCILGIWNVSLHILLIVYNELRYPF